MKTTMMLGLPAWAHQPTSAATPSHYPLQSTPDQDQACCEEECQQRIHLHQQNVGGSSSRQGQQEELQPSSSLSQQHQACAVGDSTHAQSSRIASSQEASSRARSNVAAPAASHATIIIIITQGLIRVKVLNAHCALMSPVNNRLMAKETPERLTASYYSSRLKTIKHCIQGAHLC
jgi:hypothetical protein